MRKVLFECSLCCRTVIGENHAADTVPHEDETQIGYCMMHARHEIRRTDARVTELEKLVKKLLANKGRKK